MNRIAFILLLPITILIGGCAKNDKEVDSNKVQISLSCNDGLLYNNTGTQFMIEVTGETRRAELFFDGNGIGVTINQPYVFKFTPVDVDPGTHIAKCIVESQSGKQYSDSITVQIQLRTGDEFKGGVVFYLDNSGCHGLIASKKDLGVNTDTGFFWGRSGRIGTSKDDGVANTVKMASVSPSELYAAYFFKNGYNYNGFSDWYIPSINELEILKTCKDFVGGFSNSSDWKANYWSSSEINDTNAEALHFNVLMGNSYLKGSYALKVRPIRKF